MKKSKGFTAASIRKVLSYAVALLNFYRDIIRRCGAAAVKMCISAGNRKIGRVMNVSLMPVITCANCKECKHFCYDIKACLQYMRTVIDARCRNTALLFECRDEYFARIDAAMTRRRRNKFFRWHVAGEIVDIDYFDRMIQNARKHSDFVIWTYTKNYSIVNEWLSINGVSALPSNFTVMFSEWKGTPIDNPYNMPVFACHMPGDPEPDTFKCPGNCDICKKLGRGCIAGENTHADLH